MAYENLCMYCFEELGGRDTCPHCGRDAKAAVPQIQMVPGTLVYHDRFLIGRALGQDATGIVYAALDTKKQNKLRIREYLPRDCAGRLNDGAVAPMAGMEERFEAGVNKLRASVEEEQDPRRRHFFFEENGTAYIVQRRSAAAAAAPEAEDDRRRDPDEDEGHKGRGLIIALVAAIVVIAAAVALLMLFGGKLNGSQDVTETPTLDPGQVWMPSESPTATPYATPTFAALVDPDLSWMDWTDSTDNGSGNQSVARTATPRPTAAPTISGDSSSYSNVNERSNASDIKKIQQRLVKLGWLSEKRVSGSYDSATRQAVRDFQRYINENYNPATKLDVDGIAGPKTQQWLYQTNAVKPTATPRPTATPKPQVTADPNEDAVLDENSSSKKIRAMQRELILLGVMPEGADNGKYDATTRAAVKRFQNRVNQLQGYEVLEATGRMDALSMAFLDYYVDEWRVVQTATATPKGTVTATPAPTATAAPTATPEPTAYDSEKDPGVVNAASDRTAIQDVQRRLIAIGMLPEGSDDGVYGGATQRAVASFQQWVNQRRNEQTLPVNGEADALTRSYLRYCEENDMRPNAQVTQAPTATATATAEPTAEVTNTPAPTDTPEPEETEAPEEITIDRNSDKASIRRVQELLADVGLLSRKGIDGIYGKGTTAAVTAFQEYVNAHGGELEVTGTVDNDTRLTLEYYSGNGMTVEEDEPTAAPEITAEPTAEPEDEEIEEKPENAPVYEDGEISEAVDISVDEDSETDSIRYVQEMLSEIGALSEEDVSGDYDSATRQAVLNFQRWVNSQSITTLEVTGVVDNGTRQMLEYCSDHGLRMTIDDISVDAGELEEEGGEVDPDDPFNEPDYPEEEDTAETGEDPFRGGIERVNVVIDDVPAGGEPVQVGGKSFVVKWSAEGEASRYSVYVYNSAGDAIISREGIKDTGFRVDVNQMIPGEVYTVTVGALPEGGTVDDVVWQNARFVRPIETTPTPAPLPTVGEVETPSITITGGETENGVTVITENSFSIAWSAEGGVQGYDVEISDQNGNIITRQSGISQRELSVKASSMQPGVVYTIAVGAIPVNGTSRDAVWNRMNFMRPAPVTPEPTEAPTAEPTAVPTPTPTPAPTVAEVGRPAVTVGGSGYQQDGVQYMTDNTIIVSWGAEGDVDSYIVYVENAAGERHSLGTTTDTSRTVSASSLPAGMYTVYVGAVPAYGGQEDAVWGTTRFGIPAPTAEPTEVPTPEPMAANDPDSEVETPSQSSFSGPIDADADSGTIERLQMRLYRLGVMAEEPEQGVLDRITLQAVAEFQMRANEEYDAGLNVIDPSDPNAVVDANTLNWIETGL